MDKLFGVQCMKIVTKKRAVLALAAALMLPITAAAQDSRIALTFTPAVAASSGDSQLALAGTVSYRFAEHFSFEGDVTWLDAPEGREFNFDPRVAATVRVVPSLGGLGGERLQPGFVDRIFGNLTRTLPSLIPVEGSAGGDTWIGTMGVRYEPGVQTARFRPYVSGGIGINFTDQTVSLAAVSVPDIYDGSLSHSGVALSAGGGANIHLGGALWANADAKYFRLSRDRDVMRLGGGITFKF